MSYDAMRWAMAQTIPIGLTKFVLVAMADCVNAEAQEMVCWPSYRFLVQRTGMNMKTVEASVARLKQEGFLVDTGRRAGETGKVVVYRLNDPVSGVIAPGPQASIANGTRPHKAPENGVIDTTEIGVITAEVIPPNPTANPPNFDAQSPQKLGSMTPKTGGGTRNGTRNRTRKEPGSGDAPLPAIPDVPPEVLRDYLTVRKNKRGGEFTDTAQRLMRNEAERAGISFAGAMEACCQYNWIGFNAGWYLERIGKVAPAKNGGTNGHRNGYTTARAARMAEAVPTLVANGHAADEFIEAETRDVTPRRLG